MAFAEWQILDLFIIPLGCTANLSREIVPDALPVVVVGVLVARVVRNIELLHFSE